MQWYQRMGGLSVCALVLCQSTKSFCSLTVRLCLGSVNVREYGEDDRIRLKVKLLLRFCVKRNNVWIVYFCRRNIRNSKSVLRICTSACRCVS